MALTWTEPRSEERAERQVDLAITGMTCAACVARVERRLNAMDGVSANVNLASERASAVVDDDVSVDALVAAIERAGYGAEVLGGVGAGPAARSGGPGGTFGVADRAADDARVRSLGRRLVVSVVLFAPLCDLSLVFWVLPDMRFPGWQWLMLALAAPVVVWAAWPFHAAAFRNARHGTATMDTLVSIGIIASTIWSIVAMFFRDAPGVHVSTVEILFHRPGGAIYLDVAATVTTFLLAGRYFEAWSKRRTGDALRALAAVGARDVHLLDPDGVERTVPVDQLQVGDRFVVRPGEKIATDGQVASGRSSVDCATMTGEPVPVDATPGSQVVGGTIALDGRLVVEASGVGTDTQLGQMVLMVEQAQTEKAAVQRLADRISGVFVPAVLVFSVLTLAGWLLAGSDVTRAASAALAVLIIACPCALGLATPTALLVASGRGAQLGIFFKGHQSLESSRRIDTVVLDKTGTITEGRMTVSDVAPRHGIDQIGLLRMAAAVEQASEHAVAAAIVAAARSVLEDLPPVEEFEALPGLGTRGTVEGRHVVVGRPSLFAGECDVADVADVAGAADDAGVAGAADGAGAGTTVVGTTVVGTTVVGTTVVGTTVVVSVDGTVAGTIVLEDAVKPSAAPAVAELRRMGLRCVLLTGDNRATAERVAAMVGVDEVIAEALPGDKVAFVRDLQGGGASVAVVGDGVNDGPALACADLGIAVGAGTDVAIDAADLILLRGDLAVVPRAIGLARATLTTIRRNYLWAFAYNVAAIPLAAAGLLDPLIAGAAMGLSSVFVVANSARLRRYGR